MTLLKKEETEIPLCEIGTIKSVKKVDFKKWLKKIINYYTWYWKRIVVTIGVILIIIYLENFNFNVILQIFIAIGLLLWVTGIGEAKL